MSRIQKYNNWLFALGGTMLFIVFCLIVYMILSSPGFRNFLGMKPEKNTGEFIKARTYPNPDSVEFSIQYSQPIAVDSPSTYFAVGIKKEILYDEDMYYEYDPDRNSVIPGWKTIYGGSHLNILLYNKLTDKRKFVFDHEMDIEEYKTGVFNHKPYVLIIASEKGSRSNRFFVYDINESKLIQIEDKLNAADIELLNAAGDVAISYTEDDFKIQALKIYSLQDGSFYDLINDDVRNTVSGYLEEGEK